jgi:hypothetical protein
VENVATVDETLRAAQSAQGALRIEHGVKSLRTKIGSIAPTDDDDPSGAWWP